MEKRLISNFFVKIPPLVGGILFCASFSLLAVFLAEQFGLSPVVYSLFLGLFLNFIYSNRILKPGVDFSSKSILRAGVALMGIKITLTDVISVGVGAAILLMLGTILTILIGILMAKIFKRDIQDGIISGCSVGICGASAAIAASSIFPASKSKESTTAVIIVVVTIFSTIAMIFYPYLLSFIDLNEKNLGIMLGGSIHDVAQVVGAGMMMGGDVANDALISKMFRVALLVPIIILISLFLTKSNSITNKNTPTIPLFLVVFIFVVIVNSSGFINELISSVILHASNFMIVCSMFAIGMKTNFGDIARVGYFPILMVLVETVFIVSFLIMGVVYFI